MEDSNKENLDTLDQPQLASRWDRLWAALIDAGLAMLLIIPFMIYMDIWDIAKENGGIPLNVSIRLTIFGLILFLLMHGYLLNKYGQTIGKYLLKISIVTMDNEKPDFAPLILKRYIPQWLFNYIPFIGSFLPTIDALFIFRKDKRCIHDLIAGTKVIANSANKASQPTPKDGAAEL